VITLGNVQVPCPLCGEDIDVTVIGTPAADGRTITVTTDDETEQHVRDHVETAHRST
jgi:hypothetical protein